MADALFYVSSHGFGHAARQQGLIAALAADGVRVHVRSAAPAKFFHAAHHHHAQRFDIGMIQHDPLRYDVEATAAWYADFIAHEPALIADEAAYARQHDVRLILSDMPPVACAVGAALGVPSVVITHFTWDWVYEHYVERCPAFAPIIAHITQQYAQAALALQMPFAHPFPQFTQVEPVGLFANAPTRPREAVRRLFDVPADHRVALLTMGGHGWGQTDVRALAGAQGWTFLVMPGAYEQVARLPTVRCVPVDFPAYHDLIAAADVVIGKAGGSTVAEVIAHGVPMIYTLTADWRESALLDAALRQHGRGLGVSLADFERGAWVDLLEQAAALPPAHHPLAADGPAQAVARLRPLWGGVL
ncbi:MAG: glycosyltransferase [Anaerolinea sp.]